MTASIADLWALYYGGGADAEYAALKTLTDAGVTAATIPGPAAVGLRATGVKGETYSRSVGGFLNSAILTSGKLHLSAIWLAKGTVVTNIGYVSGTTPLSGGSNQWFGLFDSSRNKLRVTADDTSTAWSASSIKTLALSSTYTVPTSGLYYVGICIVATVPSLLVSSVTLGSTVVTGQAPILAGQADTGLTNPASCPSQATTLTSSSIPYAFVT